MAVYDKEDNKTGMYNTDVYSFERNMFDCCICQPASFWKKRVADIVGKFDEDLHYAMDYDYWLRMDRAGGRILHIPDILAASRRYEGTKTLSQREEIFKEIFKICKTHGNYVSRSYFDGLWCPGVPFHSGDYYGYTAPTVIDVDGDGDMDILLGDQSLNINFIENVG
ncbi:MAG: hypothetical protein KR126chlam6_01533, partial [Candidatus Anoxychlamydiales bacterium]|nr:hypothetical protein [Candidatus Anoxychlamydiales bacterium]